MPTYEYQCPEGHRFEKFQKMTDKAAGQVSHLRQARGPDDLGWCRIGVPGQRLLHHRLRQGREGPRKPEKPEKADKPAESKSESKSDSTPAKPETKPSKKAAKRVSDLLRGELARVAATLGADGIDFVLERPRDTGHGDLATNLAMVIARQQRSKPRPVAERVVAELRLPPDVVARTEIAGPGFINFWLAEDQLAAAHRRILAEGPAYGRSPASEPLKVNVEFVSANPTGPLHVGHGRGAALGDAISTLLEWTGHTVTREFYINDAGVQIDRRGPEPLGEDPPGGRARRRRFPRAATMANTFERTPETCWPGKDVPSPISPSPKAFAGLASGRSGFSARSRIATWPPSVCGSTSCPRSRRSTTAARWSGRSPCSPNGA